MNCSGCGLPVSSDKTHCVVCGNPVSDVATRSFDKHAEAQMYESLQRQLVTGEMLLGAVRGRASGDWKKRLRPGLGLFMAPAIQIGAAEGRLVLQQINPKTGDALEGAETQFDADEIRSLTCADADPFHPGRTVRITVTLENGDSFRVKTAGRLARAGKELAEVWKSIQPEAPDSAPATCRSCHKDLPDSVKFCPFCGAKDER